ncbi:MAG TPA: TIGR03085 family metal-binding protein [Actinoplanes sp.]|nr:TIGR03085 family metal-binding protein [Actinoplanes sp.]
MTRYASHERRALAQLLGAVGPDAPTLCEGWTTRDLAAHLVARDRRPDSVAAGLIRRAVRVTALAEHSERVRLAAAAKPYPRLVHDVANPPWWSPLSNPVTDELVNLGEFFIHHEDVRRAGADWQPRSLGVAHQQALWRTVRLTAPMGLRRLGLPVSVQAPGLGTLRVGGDPAAVTLVGAPGELMLFLSGRQRAAVVELHGAAEPAQRLRSARLGI